MSSSAERRAALPPFAQLDARVRSAVEHVAAIDPTPMDPLRGLYLSDDLALALAKVGPAVQLDDRLQAAADRLGLTALEGAVLGLCAAPELHPHYGRLYAYLQDDVARRLPSPRLIARLLAGDEVTPADVIACFARDAALRRHRALTLVEFGGPTPLAERGALLAEPLAGFLLGADLDAAINDGRLVRHDPPARPSGREACVDQIRRHAAVSNALPLVVAGPDAADVLASALRQPLLLQHAADAADEDITSRETIIAALEGRRIAFHAVDTLAAIEPAEREWLLTALATRERPFAVAASRAGAALLVARGAVVIDVPAPSLAERRAAWAAASGIDTVDDVAAKFQLSLAQIEEASEIAWLAATADDSGSPSPADLDRGAREASRSRLGELAARLMASADWSDLVLPDRQRAALQSISGYLRHRDRVLTDWGFGRAAGIGQGLKILFAGESGTGKTMAAQVVAHDLGLDLFRIDLATIVSKYIGDTEKNLDRIFAAAEGSNAILFFDEADALFGKRSAVRDSHDRYANIEVAYLLQRMDSYPGAVILATNLRQNVDEAFIRRLDFIIEFPFPEAPDRERIWRQLLPATAPLADDVDVTFLGERFKLSGGSIRNAVVAAAFQAAAEGGPIGMRQLVQAVALEYGKLGRLTLETEFERFHEMVRE